MCFENFKTCDESRELSSLHSKLEIENAVYHFTRLYPKIHGSENQYGLLLEIGVASVGGFTLLHSTILLSMAAGRMFFVSVTLFTRAVVDFFMTLGSRAESPERVALGHVSPEIGI